MVLDRCCGFDILDPNLWTLVWFMNRINELFWFNRSQLYIPKLIYNVLKSISRSLRIPNWQLKVQKIIVLNNQFTFLSLVSQIS
jgi:hypothetical protein